MKIWLVILGAGVLTYGMRVSFFFLMGRVEASALVFRALRFVPLSVLSAIIVPELLMPNGSLQISVSNLRLAAGMLAGLVAWRTKNVVLTILTGMAALLLMQSLTGL